MDKLSRSRAGLSTKETPSTWFLLTVVCRWALHVVEQDEGLGRRRSEEAGGKEGFQEAVRSEP